MVNIVGQQKGWRFLLRKLKSFQKEKENVKICPQYLQGQHPLYPAACWVFISNVVDEAFVQAFFPGFCWVDTKTNLELVLRVL